MAVDALKSRWMRWVVPTRRLTKGYYYTNVSMINVVACFFHVLSSFIHSVSKYTYLPSLP